MVEMRSAGSFWIIFVWLLVGLLVQLVNGGAPEKDELRQKSMKELRSILKSKGAKCKKCVEKDDLIDRVIETWDLVPRKAESPDGKIKMTKEQFVKNLESSYRQQFKDRPRPDQPEGHQLASDDDGDEEEDPANAAGIPDLDKVWADFSKKLAAGEIKTDEKGHLVYEVMDGSSGYMPSWTERYRTHIMVGINALLLFFMQRMRRQERALRRDQDLKAAVEKQKKEAEQEAEKNEQLTEKDEQDKKAD